MATKRTPKNPDEATLRELGLSFPETTEEFPWDHRALKVKGKAFVFMGTGKDGGADHDDFFISCKLPESAPMALTIPGVKPTGYGLGKAGWVSAQWPPGKAPIDMLCDWLRESYCAVAPKKLAALLDPSAAPPKKAATEEGREEGRTEEGRPRRRPHRRRPRRRRRPPEEEGRTEEEGRHQEGRLPGADAGAFKTTG